MDERTGLREEPIFKEIPRREYLGIVLQLLLLSLITGLGTWVFAQGMISHFWTVVGLIMAWSTFGLSGILLIDVVFSDRQASDQHPYTKPR